MDGDKINQIIQVNHLVKAYGNIKAVNDVNFYVEKGKLFAFLGPNGAGKSTTINMICTFLKPDEGTVYVNGFELGKQDDAIRKSIGVVFQESLLDGLLTVRENLCLRGSFYNLSGKELEEAVSRAAKATEIETLIDRPYGNLSGGQRRRVDIARALLHTPKILFLDEPTTGLDPQTRKNVWDTIRKLQEEHGMTVFLTTHYMEEAEDADYCMIIDDGKVVAKGTPYTLKENYAKHKVQLKPIEKETLIKQLEDMGIAYKEQADIIELTVNETMEALPILNKVSSYIESFTVIKGSMDDVFITITGKEIRE